jgi:hypothetical protein
MKKEIAKIEIQKIPDYEMDLSYLGTFGDEAGTYAIEHTEQTRWSYKYFNAENVENMEQARKNYNIMMKYERGELFHIGIKAVATIHTSHDGNSWLINRITSGGVWGIEQGYKGDEEDIQSIIEEQKDELRDVLLALDFPADEIDEKLKLAQVVNV